jgi:hypothetical protein
MPKAITWPDAYERRQFIGFPGEHGPGTVTPLSELGLTEEQAQSLIDELPLPFVIVDVDEADVDEPQQEDQKADESEPSDAAEPHDAPPAAKKKGGGS